jgi:hypothetical protein
MRLDQAKQNLMHPSDFTIQFWPQLTSTILIDIKSKQEILEGDSTCCQACYIVNQFAIHYKGIRRKELEKATALRQLDTALQNPPYIYTITQIQDITNDSGISLKESLSLEEIDAYVEERIRAKDALSCPEIILIRLRDNKEYYIKNQHVIPLFVGKLKNLKAHLRGIIIKAWSENLDNYISNLEMERNNEFYNYVRIEMRKYDPVFPTLLNYNLLYLCLSESEYSKNQLEALESVLDEDEGSLYPLLEIFELDRIHLLREAKLRLPFWKLIPIISHILIFFKKLFGKDKRKSHTQGEDDVVLPVPQERSESEGEIDFEVGDGENSAKEGDITPPAAAYENTPHLSKKKKVDHKKVIQDLMIEMLPAGQDIDEELQHFEGLWNPIVDKNKGENLVEDVNSLAKGYIRKANLFRRGKVLGKKQLTEMAITLAENDTFERIKDRDSFTKYLELYMLKHLR